MLVGWAIFEDNELKLYGSITSASTDMLKRIHIMIDNLKQIIQDNETIDKIIVEEVRPDCGSSNVQTHKALMYLHAALEFLIHDDFNKKIDIEYIYPSSWRAKCGIKNGRGIHRETLKQADIRFVKEKFNIETDDDTADAIAIGYSYFVESTEKSEMMDWGA